MNRLIAAVLASLSLASFSPAAVAQTGTGSTTGSGSAVITDPIAADRAARLQGFRTAMVSFEKTETQHRDRWATFQKKRATLRRECNDLLRRSNRDTRLPTLLDCYSRDLSAETALLTQELTYLEKVPGVTKEVREEAVRRVRELQSAIDAALFAAKSGVYRTLDDATQVRRNLGSLYRDPAWRALKALRIDRQLTWTALLLQEATEARADEGALMKTARPEWDTAIACLEGVDASLRALASTGSLAASLTRGRACADDLATIPKAGKSSSSSSK